MVETPIEGNDLLRDRHPSEEIVARPLPVALRRIPALAGVTVMGEGQRVLILEVEEALGEPGISGLPSGIQDGLGDLSGSP